MPSQGVFANQSPDSGSIRVLYQTINNKDVVKAITVSDIDINGDNIAISLTELDTITLPLTGSGGNTELVISSIKQKDGYHFLDVVNTTVNTVSQSIASPIAVAPYLTETFFYNDYNALISNAETSRKSFLKYDVDRTGGQVKPSNYNAVAGIETATISKMEYTIAGLQLDQTSAIGYAVSPAAQSSIGFLTSDPVSVLDDEDFTFRIGPQEADAALGFPQKPVISLENKTFHSNGGSLKVTSTLSLRFSSNADFASGTGVNTTIPLAEQVYEDGITNSSTSKVNLRITSGSYNGLIHMRLEQLNTVQASSDISQTILVESILVNNPESEDFLNINIHRDFDEDQHPYAPKASVQDSNYTTSGIVNARYKGTKTDSSDYSGIEPAIAAQPFQAAIYDIGDNDLFICSQSLSDRTIEDFLFIGSSTSPTVSISTLGSIVSSNVLSSASDTVLDVALRDLKLADQLKQGDILRVTNGSNTELLQVISSVRKSTLGVVEINVVRDYANESAGNSFPTNAIVSRFIDNRLFKIDGNRLIAITAKKVWVKENRTILKTSQNGYVTELSTTCSV
mgnify:CR=1 FL=1|tara:strand:+ start:2050 stop:3753 length:1704 start_codon:yes stop_codon:yes gene_type:complete